MKKLIKFSLSIVLVATVFASGCDEFLNDAAKNPNSPTNVPVRLQIPALTAGLSFVLINGIPARISANWTQQTSKSTNNYYYYLDRYQLGEPWFGFNGIWNSGYTQIAKNARIAYMQAEEKGYSNYKGMAELIFVWSMSIMTDNYGAIPYSEAFNPSITSPVYDQQKDIYPKLLTLLDDAIAAFAKGDERTLGSSDLLYGGDMQKWTRLAYTLKARLLMRLTEAPDNKKQERAQNTLAALSKGFQSNADNAIFPYHDKNGQRNPWYVTLNNPEVQDVQMSAFYINLLKSLDDPRLPLHAQPAVLHEPGKKYMGHANGAPDALPDSISSIGLAYAGPAAPGRLMDYAEAKFLEAQALLITQGPVAADQAYRDAITTDMENLGISEADINTYLSNIASLGASTHPLKDIMVQKYIANFLSPQAWYDWRKTGYPILMAAMNPQGEQPGFTSIPRRYPWPAGELNSNAASLEALSLPLDYNVMLETVWWDTRGSNVITYQ